VGRLLPGLASRLDEAQFEIETLTSVLGDGVRRQLREGDAISAEIVHCLGQFLDAHRDELASLPSGDAKRPLAVLEDPTIPQSTARAILDSSKLLVVMLAIGAAAGRRTRLEPWLALALAERVVRGLRAHLCLLALVPGIDVSEQVLPREMRIVASGQRGSHFHQYHRGPGTHPVARRRIFALPVGAKSA
jgi:hypothetical protein